jgi:ABC-type sugar transport system ATPase subunit
MASLPRTEMAKAQTIASTLELDALLDRYPRQLSGGQRQRVAMGRAMILEPKVSLYNEPLSNLDLELRVRLRLEIAQMQKSLKSAAVYVTHDQTDRIVVLRKGRIEQVGGPKGLYDRRRTSLSPDSSARRRWT